MKSILLILSYICLLSLNTYSQKHMDSIVCKKGFKAIGIGTHVNFDANGKYTEYQYGYQFRPYFSYFIINKLSLTLAIETSNYKYRGENNSYENADMYLFSPSLRYYITKRNRLFFEGSYYNGNYYYANSDSVASFWKISAVGVGVGLNWIISEDPKSLFYRMGLEIHYKQIFSVNEVNMNELPKPFTTDIKVGISYFFK